MKKILDILLVLILAGVVGYLIYIDGKDGVLVGTPVPVPSLTMTTSAAVAPINNATAALLPASVTVPAKIATLTPQPTATPTLTLTPTPTATLTPTKIPAQSLLDQEIADGIQRGNQIVNAIEAYRAAQGFYPPALNDLVPGYLPEIPFTVNGQPFFYYRLFTGSGPMAPELYWLAFKAESQDHVTCTYLRRLDYWDCNFESP